MTYAFLAIRFRRLLPAAFALFLVLPHLAERGWGQRTTASIAGSVTDATGSTVPGASVSVRNLSTDAERAVISNDLGYYVVTALPAGRYSVTVKKPGFQTQSVEE